jgi:hypothetical protein
MRMFLRRELRESQLTSHKLKPHSFDHPCSVQTILLLVFRRREGEWSALEGRQEVLGTALPQKQNFEVKLVSTGS